MGTKTMKGCTAGLSVAEMRTEVAHERIDPDAFDRLCVAMQGVELAASLRVAEVLPVGGFVASAGKARLFDEGFEQDWAIRVASMPVLGQASADQGEDAGGEVTAMDPRQDEEARVIDDEVQMALALLAAPADGLIARLGFPGAGAEAKHGDDFACGAHEVAQLRSRQELMTEIVMAFDIGVPEQRVALLVTTGSTCSVRQIDGWWDRRRKDGAFDVGMCPISARVWFFSAAAG